MSDPDNDEETPADDSDDVPEQQGQKADGIVWAGGTPQGDDAEAILKSIKTALENDAKALESRVKGDRVAKDILDYEKRTEPKRQIERIVQETLSQQAIEKGRAKVRLKRMVEEAVQKARLQTKPPITTTVPAPTAPPLVHFGFEFEIGEVDISLINALTFIFKCKEKIIHRTTERLGLLKGRGKLNHINFKKEYDVIHRTILLGRYTPQDYRTQWGEVDDTKYNLIKKDVSNADKLMQSWLGIEGDSMFKTRSSRERPPWIPKFTSQETNYVRMLRRSVEWKGDRINEERESD